MYKLVVAGGTFDLLHKGHKSFLNQILNQTDKLVLGLTTDKYVSQNKESSFQNYEIREKNLNIFLSNYKNTVEIIPINDIYGPLLSSEINPDIIAVTDETKRSVEIINLEREKLGLSILPSIVISMDLSEDGLPISSTRIRNGEINREGKLYLSPSWKGKNFKLPVSLRDELKEPFGKILDSIPNGLRGESIITVGDITTKLFNENNINQFLSIIDFQVQRKVKFNSTSDLGFEKDINAHNLENQQGTLSYELFEKIREIIATHKRSIILINGEEDLAVLPCILLSPLNYSIFYGQPNEGLVEVLVTEEAKEKAYRLLGKFLIS